MRFLLSTQLKALLSAGPGSKAAEELEQGIASGTITFECASELAAELSTSEDVAHAALRSWLSSFIAQLHAMKSGTRVAVRPLGFFQIHRYQEFAGVNPKTKMPIPMPPRCCCFFKPSVRLCCGLSTQPFPDEVSHEEFVSTLGPILSLETYDEKSILGLVSKVPGHMPGISQAEIRELA